MIEIKNSLVSKSGWDNFLSALDLPDDVDDLDENDTEYYLDAITESLLDCYLDCIGNWELCRDTIEAIAVFDPIIKKYLETASIDATPITAKRPPSPAYYCTALNDYVYEDGQYLLDNYDIIEVVKWLITS